MPSNSQTAMLLQLALVASVASLAACEQTPPKAKTVAFYVENKAEREAMVEACKHDTAGKLNQEDCANAATALVSNWGKTPLPPISFGGASSPSK